MKVLLTENQYKTILLESFKEKIISSLDKNKDFTKKIVSDSNEKFKGSFRFLLTYGAGIGAIMGPVYEYLNGEFPTLTEPQISGLVIMAISIVYFENKDFKKEQKQLKEDGLETELDVAVDFTSKLKNKFVKILKVAGLSIGAALDIVAYTFLLPIIGLLISVITKYGFKSDEFYSFLEGVATSAGITLVGTALREILMRLGEKISNTKG